MDLNSKLLSEDIYIDGSKIKGSFDIINGNREVFQILLLKMNKKLNIKTDDIINVFKKSNYTTKKNL